jgi:macrolide-specific efflux system membrane fusion protein
MLAFVVVLAAGCSPGFSWKPAPPEKGREVTPTRGAIRSVISTTGTVLPKNRLEVKSPVSGRVEEILVKEGDKVKAGQTIAWMSSTERAALIDAARGKDEGSQAYWQETYKPIPLVAPIDGDVIVATVQPGQTITTSDAVIVLSDRLIVRAQVDETDIGKVKEGQAATVILDAYPDNRVRGKVEHIYHESQTVNNVTIYEVDILPEDLPAFFRSGMNATIEFLIKSNEEALLIPEEAVERDKDETWVWIQSGTDAEPIKGRVTLGMSDDKNVEVLSGLTEGDRVVIRSKKYSLPKNDTGTNPFMPGRRR